MRFHAYIATSVGGYVATPDGGVAWLESFNDEGYDYEEFIAAIGAIVMGRTTYDQVVAFDEWIYGRKDVYILTSRPLDVSTPRTTVWHDGPGSLVEVRSSRGGEGDAWLLGEPKSINAFREFGALDT